MGIKLVTRVDYSERDTGDVGLLDGRGIGLVGNVISGSIELGEKIAHEVHDGEVWSHAWIAGPRPMYTLEAIWPRVSLSRWGIYDGRHTAVFRINVPMEKKLAALLQIQNEWLGKGYNLTGVVDLGANEILRHFGIFNGVNRWDNERKSFCSQLDTRYLHILIGDEAVNSLTDPQGLYNYLSELAK